MTSSSSAASGARRGSFFARTSDARLATLVGVVLWALAAWPIPLLDVAPYQDLAGHLATVTIIEHLDKYPEFVFNGFLKTNSALICFVYFVGKLVGIKGAARLFVLGVLAANAFAFPRFVLQLTDRKRMLVASLFLLPMIHNWWVSMGMLNFSLGIALALETLVHIDRQRAHPTAGRAALIAGLTLVTWYAHSIPLFVVGALVVVHVALEPSWRARIRGAQTLLLPIVPSLLLVVFVMISHVLGTGGPRSGAVDEVEWPSAISVPYDLWSTWFYGFTTLSASSLVTAIALAAIGVWRFRDRPRFFPPIAMAGMFAGCWLLPNMMPGFGYVNVRLAPFVWMAALVRVPARLPRMLVVALAASAALYAVGQSIDLFRLEGDQRAFTAGMSAVPEGARMLTLNFRERVTSKNTWSLHTTSGLYAMEKLATAQDIWADSPTMPIMYRAPPDFLMDPVLIRHFAAKMATCASYCASAQKSGVPSDDCRAKYDLIWESFWRRVTQRFDHVILWQPPADVLERVAPNYARAFENRGLYVLERRDEAASASGQHPHANLDAPVGR